MHIESSIPENRSLRYGESLFTSARVVKGRIVFYQKHLDRLYAGIESYYLDRGLSQAEKNEVKKFIDRHLLELSSCQEWKVRISIESSQDMQLDRFFFSFEQLRFRFSAEELQRWDFNGADGEKGLRLKSFTSPFTQHYPQLKMASYMPFLFYRMQAKRLKADDALFVSEQGLVMESSSANVAFFKDERFIFPKNCIFKGIMLEVLSKNFACEFAPIKMSELSSMNFDAAFLINSVRFLRLVNSIDDTEFAPIDDNIRALLSELMTRVTQD